MPPRARVRDLVLRLLGVVYAIAFLSVAAQVTVLIGARGLLPAGEHLDLVRASRGFDSFAAFRAAPTVFFLVDPTDLALRLACYGGVAASVALALGLWPQGALVAVWVLYLSLVNAGGTFFAFQWDNLLLESAFFAWLVAPGGLRPRGAPGPHPLAQALLVWLVVRLHLESGIAKLAGGDPAWRDLTALRTYFETVPLPTPLAFHAHHLPRWALALGTLANHLLEIGVPLLAFGPRRARTVACVALVLFQGAIAATGNFGFFNLLSATLALFLLDDRQLGGEKRPHVPLRGAWQALGPFLAAALFALTLLPFGHLLGITRAGRAALHPWRTINAYHLFVRLTYVRDEVLLEGSPDGETWQPYELRYKPGDPARAPRFVAPHQPRADFCAWFLALRGGAREEWFQTLVRRLFEEPETVAPLFESMPPRPRFLRVSVFRYRFAPHGDAAWWTREPRGEPRVFSESDFRVR